jgi:hypothetical protein
MEGVSISNSNSDSVLLHKPADVGRPRHALSANRPTRRGASLSVLGQFKRFGGVNRPKTKGIRVLVYAPLQSLIARDHNWLGNTAVQNN